MNKVLVSCYDIEKRNVSDWNSPVMPPHDYGVRKQCFQCNRLFSIEEIGRHSAVSSLYRDCMTNCLEDLPTHNSFSVSYV